MESLATTALNGLGVLAGIYVFICVAMFALEPRLVFPAPQLSAAWLSREAELQGARELSLVAEDGTRLYGWFIETPGPRAVLYFSGNATSVGADPLAYARWRAEGVSVLHANYRGYPGSAGAPSEAGLSQDAEAAWTWLRERYAAEDIVIVGRSLGGGVATALAARHRPRALALLATYASAVRVAQDTYPWLPVGLLMRNRFETTAHAATIDCPVVIVHGTDDDLIRPTHPPILAAAFPGSPEPIWVQGAGHNDPLLTDPVAWQAVRELAR